MGTSVIDWLEGYRAAWEERDPDAAAALFTDDASYREQPYHEPFLGKAGVRDYWASVTATQADVKFRYGTPVVEGREEGRSRMVGHDDQWRCRRDTGRRVPPGFRRPGARSRFAGVLALQRGPD